MKAPIFFAAAFALCTSAAFAQTTPSSTTNGTMQSGTTTPNATGTMNNSTVNGTGTMNSGTGTMSDKGAMRSNSRMNKGGKMKSKTSNGTTTKGSM